MAEIWYGLFQIMIFSKVTSLCKYIAVPSLAPSTGVESANLKSLIVTLVGKTLICCKHKTAGIVSFNNLRNSPSLIRVLRPLTFHCRIEKVNVNFEGAY